MNFKITSIQTIGEMLYLDVEFLDDAGKVIHHEDFIMQIAPTQLVYVGPPLARGQLPDPADYEEQATDAEAVILQNITTFINGGLVDLPKDNRDYRIQPDNLDPLGLKEDPKVIELIGVVKGETGK